MKLRVLVEVDIEVNNLADAAQMVELIKHEMREKGEIRRWAESTHKEKRIAK